MRTVAPLISANLGESHEVVADAKRLLAHALDCGACVMGHTEVRGGSAVSLRGAPREYTGYEYAEHSGMRPSTAECVSSRVLVGRQEHVFRF